MDFTSAQKKKKKKKKLFLKNFFLLGNTDGRPEIIFFIFRFFSQSLLKNKIKTQKYGSYKLNPFRENCYFLTHSSWKATLKTFCVHHGKREKIQLLHSIHIFSFKNSAQNDKNLVCRLTNSFKPINGIDKSYKIFIISKQIAFN